MKPYLVDIPVRMNIWIRPECQRRQWDVIKQARPSILFIQSDGGRNEKEWDAIRQNRAMVDAELDWDCQVHRFYEDVNNGLYAMGKKVSSFIWSQVDRCLFLEDDQVMSVSFFQFCAELLERYKDDERIECICGVNTLEKSPEVNSDYFFSRQGSIWGTATWRRCVLQDRSFDYKDDEYVMKLLKQRTRRNPTAWKRLQAYAAGEMYEGHPAGSEFWREHTMYSQNRLQIIPKMNMVSNIGSTDNSEHATSMKKMPRKLRRLFDMPVYEVSFPLRHAKYVIPDVEYEKKRNRLLNHNHPILKLLCDIERIFLSLKYDGLKRTIRLLQQKAKKRIEK